METIVGKKHFAEGKNQLLGQRHVSHNGLHSRVLRLVSFTILLFLFQNVFSQHTDKLTEQAFIETLSLDTILSRIEKNNPELLMFDYNEQALDAYAEGAGSWNAPEVSAGPFMVPYNFSKYSDMGMLMIAVQQMIPNPAKLEAKENYLLAKSSVVRENQAFLRTQLFAEAKRQYYDWVVLKKKQNVLEKSEELMNFIIKVSELRYPYDQEKLHNIYKAKAALYELNNKQLALKNDLKQKNINLNILLNQEKDLVFNIDTSIVIKDLALKSEDSLSLKASRSDIHALEQSIRLAELNQALTLSEKKPDFGVRYEHMNTFGNGPNQFSLMGTVTIPIAPWASKSYKANAKAMDFEISAMEAQKQAIVNKASGKLENIRNEFTSGKQQLEMYEDHIIPALRNNHKTSLLAYEQNTEDLFVVLEAWNSLQVAQLAYLNKLQVLLNLQVEYEKEIEER